MSSHFTEANSTSYPNSHNSSFSKAGKSFSLIILMISLIFVMPLATISLMTLSTSAASTLIFSAIALILEQMNPGRASSHLKSLARSASFS